jgi:hypothetical protein
MNGQAINARQIVTDFAKDMYNLRFDEVVFLCIRGLTVQDNILHFNDNKIGEWNDTIWLFDKNYDRPYLGTVDPSDYWVKNPMGKNGAVMALPGLTTLRMGNHRGRRAFVQTGDVLVYRDTTKNGTWEHRDMSGGSSRGINLHAAHDILTIGRDSAGCSVPKLLWSSVEWNKDFVERGEKSGQIQFYRLFIEGSELALYIGEKYNSNSNKDFAHVLYENRQRLGRV